MSGKNLEVLFEHENHNGLMKGFASNYVRVQEEYDENKINRLLNIEADTKLKNICFDKQ
jgi:hypothetical protein